MAFVGHAALGGVVLPARIYLMFNTGHPDSITGWRFPRPPIAFAPAFSN